MNLILKKIQTKQLIYFISISFAQGEKNGFSWW